MGRVLAHLPEPSEPGRPIGIGRQQRPVGKDVGNRPLRRCVQYRHGQRCGRGHRIEEAAVVRRKDPVLRAPAGLHGSGRREVVAIVQRQFEPRRHRGFRRAPPRLVVVEGMNAARPGLLRDLGQHLRRIAPPQHQPRTACLQRLRQPGQRMVQPPARRTAQLARARPDIVEDIDRDHRTPLRSGDQRGLIGQAQVAAEPDDLRRAHRPTAEVDAEADEIDGVQETEKMGSILGWRAAQASGLRVSA